MKRPSTPLVISLVALFFSITGAGFAASRELITSTGQIQPSVLAKIESATNGPPGPQGRKGEQGPEGDVGATGPTGSPGADGAVAGYSATGGNVAFSGAHNSSPTTGVSMTLPPGNYIASGHVNLNLVDFASSTPEANGTCQLVDTPNVGQTVTDTDHWSLLINNYGMLIPNYALDTLAFNMAISSPNSPSTLSISCQTVDAQLPVTWSARSAMSDSVVTAVQTSANN